MAKKDKNRKTKIKEMHDADNMLRSDEGWLCRCTNCHGLGYIEIGDPIPELCEPCYEELSGG